jgi:hypothetical protein
MKLRNLIFMLGVAGLLASAQLLAADTTPAADPAKPKATGPCDRVTGSNITPSRKDGCKSSVQPNRTYTKDDIDRTGETDLAQALRKMDPSFR